MTADRGADGSEVEVAHAARTLEQLDARIARLSLALGLSLQAPHDLDEALRARPIAALLQGAERRREEALRATLRGLLTLRYELVCKCAGNLGADATARMIFCIEQRLEAHGFSAGADGLDVDELTGRA